MFGPSSYQAISGAQAATSDEILVVTSFNPGETTENAVASLEVARVLPDGSLNPLGTVEKFDEPEYHHEAYTPRLPFVVEVRHDGVDDRGKLKAPNLARRRFDLDAVTRAMPVFSGGLGKAA